MGDLKVLNVQIRPDQFDNLKKLAALRKTTLADVVRNVLDDALGTVDAASLIFRHPDGKEEKL